MDFLPPPGNLEHVVLQWLLVFLCLGHLLSAVSEALKWTIVIETQLGEVAGAFLASIQAFRARRRSGRSPSRADRRQGDRRRLAPTVVNLSVLQIDVGDRLRLAPPQFVQVTSTNGPELLIPNRRVKERRVAA
jgi:hypothetical protein